uniref:Uncharacterized protein n=1 Tax=Glossina palpalis gambiensis TaxID=67801 RepID=A0A1B0AU79_9MUSC
MWILDYIHNNSRQHCIVRSIREGKNVEFEENFPYMKRRVAKCNFGNFDNSQTNDNSKFLKNCEEILGEHVNPLAFQQDLNDESAGDDGDDGGLYVDANDGGGRDAYDGRQQQFDDVNDDVEQPQPHFAHALQQRQPRTRHPHPPRPSRDDPILQPMHI